MAKPDAPALAHVLWIGGGTDELEALAPQVVVAEGFGFTPELITPLLTDSKQAVWMVPTEAFKAESMRRRDKPSFRYQTRDPEQVRRNLLERDARLTEYILGEAHARGLRVVMVDGSRTAQEVAEDLEAWFGGYLEWMIHPVFSSWVVKGQC